tara:strand:+ start:159 stop:938 length:780 start_codon:yes stop_codon:yes gene_type:complete
MTEEKKIKNDQLTGDIRKPKIEVNLATSSSWESEHVNLAESENCFYKDGDMWQVSFKDNRTTLKHSIGMTYINIALLQKKGGIPILELQSFINKIPAELISQEKHKTITVDSNKRKSIYKDELNANNFTGDDRKLYEMDEGDSNSYVFLSKEKKELKEEHEHSKDSDPTYANQCLNDFKKTKHLINSLYDKDGNIREATKDISKVRSGIIMAIIRAMKNIRLKASEVPGIYEHLDSCVNVKGNCLVYTPLNPIRWKTKK